MDRNNYAKIALSVVPRILSAMDRSEISDTFGCIDKPYWHYKISDFPSARCQEPILTLAILHENKFRNNIYFKNPMAKLWADAGLEFLSHIQNKDGSFNEWYPNERSFCATAFCTYSASETFRILGYRQTDYNSILNMLEKAGLWLGKNEENVSNQQAGAIAALYNIYKITGERKFKRYAEDKLTNIHKSQSKEGWIPEYGGADPSYLTVTIDFLGKYYKESNNNKTLEIVAPALKFLKYFLHTDGSIGGGYGSRNSEIKLPHGLEIFSKLNENARFLADGVHEKIMDTIHPGIMDDRYAFIYHVSYLQAFLEHKKSTPPSMPSKSKPDRLFDESGLFVRNQEYNIVINLKKGGVYKLHGNDRTFNDYGIIIVSGDKLLTTNWNNSSKYRKKENEIIVTGAFKDINTGKVLSPEKNILFRFFLLTGGRIQTATSWLKEVLRNKLITEAKDSQILYKRHFLLEDKKIIVTDEVQIKDEIKIDGIYLPSYFSSFYSPTSAFFDKCSLKTKDSIDIKELIDGPIKREFVF